MVVPLPRHSEVLNSWKEIAAFLDRGVRTVQRWERDLQLPVRRIGKGKRSPVFTTVTELKFWLSTIEFERPPKSPPLDPAPVHDIDSPGVQSLRELRLTVQNLSRTVAQNSLRQRKQAALARERMAQLRSRINPSS
jgi:hypothetical protein